MTINRIYENQNLLSLQLVSFLVMLRTYQHPWTCLMHTKPWCTTNANKDVHSVTTETEKKNKIKMVAKHWIKLTIDDATKRVHWNAAWHGRGRVEVYSLLLMPLAVPRVWKGATWENYPPVLTRRRLSKSFYEQFNENYVGLCPYSQRCSSYCRGILVHSRSTVHTLQIQN